MTHAFSVVCGLILLTATVSFQFQRNMCFRRSGMKCDTSHIHTGRAGKLYMSGGIESPYKVIEDLAASLPEEKSARLRLHIKGGSISTAIFRAELKKELTFFYGCGAKFTTPYNGKEDEAEILAEGRVSSFKRFLGIWVKGICSPMNTRKPNFQGPPLIIEVLEGEWGAHSGSFGKKFELSAGPPPSLQGAQDGSMAEARSMMGSDESVP